MIKQNEYYLDATIVNSYFNNLINHFFKILPMWETGESSLPVYLESLQIELLGVQSFISEMQDNHLLLKLLAVIQYFMDNPDCEISTVRREVFNSISICKKLRDCYSEEVS